MMVQSHDNNRVYIFFCNFQLRTKKIYHHFHVHHTVRRDLAHHELTQGKIDSRLVYRITVA